MARAVILLILAAVVVTIGASPMDIQEKKCGQNEIYNFCGTSCPSTCENLNPSVCTLACVIGCECAEGFVKNADNQCVLTQDC